LRKYPRTLSLCNGRAGAGGGADRGVRAGGRRGAEKKGLDGLTRCRAVLDCWARVAGHGGAASRERIGSLAIEDADAASVGGVVDSSTAVVRRAQWMWI
jgi:hypothetical protein